jgi:hypothetical protein
MIDYYMFGDVGWWYDLKWNIQKAMMDDKVVNYIKSMNLSDYEKQNLIEIWWFI